MHKYLCLQSQLYLLTAALTADSPAERQIVTKTEMNDPITTIDAETGLSMDVSWGLTTSTMGEGVDKQNIYSIVISGLVYGSPVDGIAQNQMVM